MIIISLRRRAFSFCAVFFSLNSFLFFCWASLLRVLTPRRRMPSARGSTWPSRSPGNRGPWASWTACAPASVVPFFVYFLYLYVSSLDCDCFFLRNPWAPCAPLLFEFGFGSFLGSSPRLTFVCLEAEAKALLLRMSSKVFRKILLIRNIFKKFSTRLFVAAYRSRFS